ncbi:HD domain-containing protein [Candidatus Saccharibacteria bacterium]|nr:HD domain-containing protein [Candidatus Saccharibacteria bacterium]
MSTTQILWDNWNKYDNLDSVMRQGFLKIKAYGYKKGIEEMLQRYHSESTLIHSGRVAMLFSDMMDLWPAYYEGVDKYIALKVALNHDIGELVVGDICDDGREEHEDKKGPEWDAVVSHYSNLDERTCQDCKDIHQQFDEANTFLGQSIRLADKLDFLAKLIKMEGQGFQLNNKKFYSSNDWALAREIDSYKFVDIVGNHLRHLINDCNFDQRLVQIATGFIACGLHSINRPFFEWWQPH